MKVVLSFLVLGVLACQGVDAFNLGTINQCQQNNANSPDTIACYPAPNCPTNTTANGLFCGSAAEVCCTGVPVCQSINCNNGTCVNDACVCNPGYNGTNCEFDFCDLATTQCLSASTTACNRLASPTFYNCSCIAGFTGTNCETDVCAGLSCINGTCTKTTTAPFGQCTCIEGFSGTNCDVDACSPDPCGANGACNRLAGGTYNCTCTSPFFGQNCTERICDLTPCQNSPVSCVSDTVSTYTCNCALNFTGVNCTEAVCPGNGSACNQNGTCVPQPDASFTCNCNNGYSGDRCEFATPQCGVELASTFAMGRAFNAINDQVQSNPWNVRFSTGLPAITTYCSGFLISTEWVVTDAFCGQYLNASGNPAKAYVGVYDINNDTFNGTQYDVTEILVNSAFTPTTYGDTLNALNANIDALLPNSVALVRLNRNITQGFTVNTVCPPKSFSEFSCNATCKVAAFGGTQNNTIPPATATIRQSVPVRLVDDVVCNAIRGSATFPGSRCGVIEGDAELCLYDNGAAVVCQDPATSQWHAQGILVFRPWLATTSAETNCARTAFQFTDMEAVWSFITGTVTI